MKCDGGRGKCQAEVEAEQGGRGPCLLVSRKEQDWEEGGQQCQK